MQLTNITSSAGILCRHALFLLVLVVLVVMPLVIIPYVPTQTPAAHSKDWMIRGLCTVTLMLLPFARWDKDCDKDSLPSILFAALIGAHVVSMLFSGRVLYCLLEHWQSIAWIVFGWLAFLLVGSIADCRKVVAVIAAAAGACVIYGLSSYAGFNLLGWLYSFKFGTEEGGRNYIHSFFGNPEYFGGYAAPVAVLGFSRCFSPWLRFTTRLAWICFTLLLILCLGLTGSRGAFLGLFAGCAMLLMRQIPAMEARLRKRVFQVLGGMLGLGLLGLIVLSTSNPLNRRDMQLLQRFAEAGNLQSASVRERLYFYTLTASSIADNPVWGAGPGTYRLDFFPNLLNFQKEDPHSAVELMSANLRNRLAEHPHNDYLEFWYEIGTVGIGLFLMIIALAFVRFASQKWREKQMDEWQRELQVLNAGYLAAILCLLINAASSFPLHLPARGTLFWILLGCFFASDRMMHKPPATNL